MTSISAMTLRTDLEHYAAMISINEKSYILLTDKGKLKIHGSSLKGKHMPIVCDLFRDQLCYAMFNSTSTFEVFKQFRDLSKYPIESFQVRVYPSKESYEDTSLYNKLIQQLAMQGIKTVLGGSMEYVKIKGGYRHVILFGGDDAIDVKHYKKKLAEIAGAILGKPAKSLLGLFSEGQECLA